MAQDVAARLVPIGYTDESMQRALERYRSSLRDALEAQHMNAYVRLDPATGDYAVGATRSEARSAFNATFGDRVAWTMHIGTA